MGYFAICLDTENNAFGIWETNEKAKWITFLYPNSLVPSTTRNDI
jgi:hypothetical protein